MPWTRPQVLLTIDPGLDDVAIATWRIPIDGPRRTWEMADFTTKLTCLDPVLYHVVTAPGNDLQARLFCVMDGVRHHATESQADVIVVETPSIGGLYRRHLEERGTSKGKLAQSVMWSHMALGAIVAGACDAGAFVKLWAPSTNKANRKANVEMVLRTDPSYRHIRNADEMDAIGVGLFVTWDWGNSATI